MTGMYKTLGALTFPQGQPGVVPFPGLAVVVDTPVVVSGSGVVEFNGGATVVVPTVVEFAVVMGEIVIHDSVVTSPGVVVPIDVGV